MKRFLFHIHCFFRAPLEKGNHFRHTEPTGTGREEIEFLPPCLVKAKHRNVLQTTLVNQLAFLVLFTKHSASIHQLITQTDCSAAACSFMKNSLFFHELLFPRNFREVNFLLLVSQVLQQHHESTYNSSSSSNIFLCFSSSFSVLALCLVVVFVQLVLRVWLAISLTVCMSVCLCVGSSCMLSQLPEHYSPPPLPCMHAFTYARPCTDKWL